MAPSIHTTPPPQMREPADGARGADFPVNVGNMERWLSLLGGGILVLATVQRSLGTVVLLGGAGTLLYRGTAAWRTRAGGIINAAALQELGMEERKRTSG